MKKITLYFLLPILTVALGLGLALKLLQFNSSPLSVNRGSSKLNQKTVIVKNNFLFSKPNQMITAELNVLPPASQNEKSDFAENNSDNDSDGGGGSPNTSKSVSDSNSNFDSLSATNSETEQTVIIEGQVDSPNQTYIQLEWILDKNLTLISGNLSQKVPLQPHGQFRSSLVISGFSKQEYLKIKVNALINQSISNSFILSSQPLDRNLNRVVESSLDQRSPSSETQNSNEKLITSQSLKQKSILNNNKLKIHY